MHKHSEPRTNTEHNGHNGEVASNTPARGRAMGNAIRDYHMRPASFVGTYFIIPCASVSACLLHKTTLSPQLQNGQLLSGSLNIMLSC